MKRRILMLASMDVDPAHERVFNEVYDSEHIPNLTKVPGVVSAVRFRTKQGEMSIGGSSRALDTGGAPMYHVLYELTDPSVLTSDAWANAVEKGRWPSEVRPFTRNRRHLLLEEMADDNSPTTGS